MSTDAENKTLFGRLGEIPDPRSRRGRSYPLRGLLTRKCAATVAPTCAAFFILDGECS